MKLIYLKNFRKGFATNSSSTHSLIYKNKDEMFKDMNIFELDYYDRFDRTIAATKEAKIKYIATNIWHHKDLFDIICSFYPEMKKYIPLINEQKEIEKRNDWRDNYAFGMCARGHLYFTGVENLQANIDLFRYIIDNDEIIIVGGSDEEDFVYETCENHKRLPEADEINKKYGVVKNGNYWVGINEFYGNRMRFTQTDEDCIPKYPELIDLKITNKCEHNCPFCYMGSNMQGKHADINELKIIINQVSSYEYSYYNRRVEFAIGGGNILLYPHLEELFKHMTEKGHIVNTTINIKDIKKICNNDEFKRIFNTYVKGVGISVCDENDLQLLEEYNINKAIPNCKIVLHLIPEMLGIKKTRKICERAYQLKYYDKLFLGYKENNRGASCKYKKFTTSELVELFKELYCISIDTTFANRYKDYIVNNFEIKHTLTFNEGEYSMYIDGVELKAYKSSYQLDKPYSLAYTNYNEKDINWFTIESAFAKIREDNGFKSYKE